MKVTFVNKYYFPPHLGGVEQSLNLLATALAARPDFEVSAVVANEGRRGVTERLDGVTVERLGRLLALASTPIAPGMPSALRRHRGDDVVHLQFPYPWGDISWLLAGAPAAGVMTYHADVVKQKRMMTLYAPALRRALERVERVIVGAPQIIENSEFLRPVAHKCRVVPFAIDVHRFDAVDDAAVERVRASVPEGPLTLFVGRLVYYKGVDVLVRAMRDVPGTLAIIGRGPLEPELRSLAEELGIADRVRFLPPVDDTELGAWYRAADVFCLPSVAKTEAFGLVQLEAHLAGTPVVSTDLPSGVPFVNAHGETGLTVPPSDPAALAAALNQLLGDDALRERLGSRARERVLTEFSLDAMVRGTLDVYREAIESRG